MNTQCTSSTSAGMTSGITGAVYSPPSCKRRSPREGSDVNRLSSTCQLDVQ